MSLCFTIQSPTSLIYLAANKVLLHCKIKQHEHKVKFKDYEVTIPDIITNLDVCDDLKMVILDRYKLYVHIQNNLPQEKSYIITNNTLSPFLM